MRALIWRFLPVFLLISAWFLRPPAAIAEQSSAGALVRVAPASGSFAVGEEIEVEVWIDNVQDLYGADVQLAFDPAVLKVLDADPATGGVQVAPRDDLLSPDWVLKKEANNKQGTVWYALTQLNPSEPANGSGALFAFTFQVIGPGEAAITIEQQLSTRLGQPISARGQGAQYTTIEVFPLYLPFISTKP
jgi:hypothetical protein